MKFGKRDKSIVDALFLLALFGVFLICALFIVLFGAKIYKNTVASSAESFTMRTGYTYITEKIRQHDNEHGIVIEDTDNGSVIKLAQSVDDKLYYTFLYCDENYLKEYTSSNETFDKALGSKIMEIQSLESIKVSDSLYFFRLTDMDNNPIEFLVTYMSKVGGDANE